MPSTTTRRFFLGCLIACAPVCVQAARSYATTFTNDADYDNRFVELSPSGASTLGLEAYGTSERGLRKRGSRVQSAIFDSAGGAREMARSVASSLRLVDSRFDRALKP